MNTSLPRLHTRDEIAGRIVDRLDDTTVERARRQFAESGAAPWFAIDRLLPEGRPEQPVRDLLLRIDGTVRQRIRKIRPQGVVKTTHLYDRPDQR